MREGRGGRGEGQAKMGGDFCLWPCLIRSKRLDGFQHSGDLHLLELGHMQDDVEGCGDLHVFHDSSNAGGADDQQLAPLGGLLLQQHQQGLQDAVAEPGADGHILKQPLDVVKDDDGEDRLQAAMGMSEYVICIVKAIHEHEKAHLMQKQTLCRCANLSAHTLRLTSKPFNAT